ncbi:hypothetical protein HYFRA_00000909 [Hymenoscyphus fraxineus]|uniref:Uncharacterized protein n=1 Tax=Hymenoscyphus fraxineus TaxID=746836 RepID=A0A9N9KU43_9HELO|nr:hypothetical protein HYFRA_00000909 [Hymenoscyphus fraxineus]
MDVQVETVVKHTENNNDITGLLNEDADEEPRNMQGMMWELKHMMSGNTAKSPNYEEACAALSIDPATREILSEGTTGRCLKPWQPIAFSPRSPVLVNVFSKEADEKTFTSWGFFSQASYIIQFHLIT